MGAVSEAIDGAVGNARLAVGEIVEIGDAIGEIRNRSDAGIDDRNADPVAHRIRIGQPELRAQVARLMDRAIEFRGAQVVLSRQRCGSNRRVGRKPIRRPEVISATRGRSAKPSTRSLWTGVPVCRRLIPLLFKVEE